MNIQQLFLSFSLCVSFSLHAMYCDYKQYLYLRKKGQEHRFTQNLLKQKDTTTFFKTYTNQDGSIINYVLMRDAMMFGMKYSEAKAYECTGVSLPARSFDLITSFLEFPQEIAQDIMPDVYSFSFEATAQKRYEQLANPFEATLFMSTLREDRIKLWSIDHSLPRPNTWGSNSLTCDGLKACLKQSNAVHNVVWSKANTLINVWRAFFHDWRQSTLFSSAQWLKEYLESNPKMITDSVAILNGMQPFSLAQNRDNAWVIPSDKGTIIGPLLALMCAAHEHRLLNADQLSTIKDIQVCRPDELSNYKKTVDIWYIDDLILVTPNSLKMLAEKLPMLNSNFTPMYVKSRKRLCTQIKEELPYVMTTNSKEEFKQAVGKVFSRPVDEEIRNELTSVIDSKWTIPLI